MISSAGRLDACRRLLGALRRNLSNESCQIILPQSLAIEMASQFLDSVVVDIVFVAHQFVTIIQSFDIVLVLVVILAYLMIRHLGYRLRIGNVPLCHLVVFPSSSVLATFNQNEESN